MRRWQSKKKTCHWSNAKRKEGQKYGKGRMRSRTGAGRISCRVSPRHIRLNMNVADRLNKTRLVKINAYDSEKEAKQNVDRCVKP